jgi:hypothetical protein
MHNYSTHNRDVFQNVVFEAVSKVFKGLLRRCTPRKRKFDVVKRKFDVVKRKFDVIKRKFEVVNDDGLLTLRTQFQGSPSLRAQRSNP